MNREEWIKKAIEEGACDEFIEFIANNPDAEFEDLSEDWKLYFFIQSKIKK